MAQPTVHHANARVGTLRRYIDAMLPEHGMFEVSDVKSDGTVFVRFKSTIEGLAATTAADVFERQMKADERMFLRTDDVKFRLALEEFAPLKDHQDDDAETGS